jgi:OOP family OmpA-OmpF porin
MKRTIALVCTTLLAAGAAQAQFSVGGSLGSSHYKGDNVGGLSTDRSDIGGKIFGGYQFNPYFGLEAGYADLGRFDSAVGNVEGDGAYVDAVGTWPLGSSLSLLGRVGAFNGKLDNSLLGSERATNVKYGAGLQYDLSKSTALRGEWERYRFDAPGGSSANTDMYSIGVNYRF